LGREVPKEFYLFTLCSLTFFTASQMVQPILPLYIVKRGASTLELGFIVSIVSFVAILAKVPMGILSSRIGKAPLIIASLVGYSITLLLYLAVPDPRWFYPVQVSHGLMISAYVPIALAVVSDLSPPGRRGDIMGQFLTSFGLATVLGPFLCGVLVGWLGYEGVFVVASLLPLLGLVPLFSMNLQRIGFGRSSWEGADEGMGFLDSFRAVILSRNVFLLSVLRIAYSFTNAFFLTIFAVYASTELGLDSSLIAILFGVKGLLNMASRIPSGRLADRIGAKKPLLFAFATLILVYLMIAEGKDIRLLAVAMALFGAVHGMRAVVEWSSLGGNVPPAAIGIATAYLSTMFNVGGALGSVACGILTTATTYQNIFRLAALIIAVGPVAALLIKENAR